MHSKYCGSNVAVTEKNSRQLLLTTDVSIKQKTLADGTKITLSYIMELRSNF